MNDQQKEYDDDCCCCCHCQGSIGLLRALAWPLLLHFCSLNSWGRESRQVRKRDEPALVGGQVRSATSGRLNVGRKLDRILAGPTQSRQWEGPSWLERLVAKRLCQNGRAQIEPQPESSNSPPVGPRRLAKAGTLDTTTAN